MKGVLVTLTLKGGQKVLTGMDDGVAHAVVLENCARVGELYLPQQKDFSAFCASVREEVERQGHKVVLQKFCPNAFIVE